MSGQSARLGEPDATKFTLKWLQVDVPLIVEYKARTLRERLVAGFPVFVDEHAFEERLVAI